MAEITNKMLDSYFWSTANKQGRKLALPFPNANPKFGNSG